MEPNILCPMERKLMCSRTTTFTCNTTCRFSSPWYVNGKTLLIIQFLLIIDLASIYSVKSGCYVQNTFHLYLHTLNGHSSFENEDHAGIFKFLFLSHTLPRKNVFNLLKARKSFFNIFFYFIYQINFNSPTNPCLSYIAFVEKNLNALAVS